MGIFVIVFLLMLFCLLYFSFCSSTLNGDRSFFIVGSTLLNCLPKNLCAGDIPMNFDGVLVNSSMARQGSLFSLLHFFMMHFICFTADSAIPLEFGISGEQGFHLNPYL